MTYSDPIDIIIIVSALIILFMIKSFEIAVQKVPEQSFKKSAKNKGKSENKIIKIIKDEINTVFALQTVAFVLEMIVIGFLTLNIITSQQASIVEGDVLPAILMSAGAVVGLLIVGKLIPQYIGLYKSLQVVNKLGMFSYFIIQITKPVFCIVSGISKFVAKTFFSVDLSSDPDAVTEDEIKFLVEEGEESGVIEDSQKEMIHNIFEFDDLTVQSVMTHRTDISALDIDKYTVDDVIEMATKGGFSRIPIYEDDIDNIIGVLYVKDLLKLLSSKDTKLDIREFMRTPLYIPETANCRKLFEQLTAKRLQMAVVVDEYGGTSGIITMEDILEAIVGNIEDEYDDEEFFIEKISDIHYIVDGSYDIEDLAEELSLDLEFDESDDIQTIGGYISAYLGEVPHDDDEISITVGDVVLTALEINENRIIKVEVKIVK